MYANIPDDFEESSLVLKVVAPPYRGKKRKRPPDPENEDLVRVRKYMFDKRIYPP